MTRVVTSLGELWEAQRRLVLEIQDDLVEDNLASAFPAELGISPQKWRSAARRAGHAMGLSVRTGRGPRLGEFWAELGPVLQGYGDRREGTRG